MFELVYLIFADPAERADPSGGVYLGRYPTQAILRLLSCCKARGNTLIKFDIVGQKNHGVCAVVPNPWDAYEHIERLEHICEIVLKSGRRPD